MYNINKSKVERLLTKSLSAGRSARVLYIFYIIFNTELINRKILCILLNDLFRS